MTETHIVTGGAGEQTTRPATPLRMPGQPSKDAHALAMDRLVEAMCLAASINRVAADAYAMAFKVAIVSAPFGPEGVAVEKLVRAAAGRLERHLATLPNASPPPSAA